MNEHEFRTRSEALFQCITQALDACGAEMDFVQTDSGRFEIEMEGSDGIVVTCHEASREIWVAARSGAYRFCWEGQEWRDTRSHETFQGTLSALIREHTGVDIAFNLA